MPDSIPVLDRILELLRSNEIEFRHVEHEPTPTSEDSARARGESLAVGGKAIVVKIGDTLRLVVLSAAKRLDSKRLRQDLGNKKIRFATREELAEATGGLVPGSVPPFGEPILPLPLHVDRSVFEQSKIAFNAGSLTHSVILDIEDYRRIAQIESIVDVAAEDDG